MTDISNIQYPAVIRYTRGTRKSYRIDREEQIAPAARHLIGIDTPDRGDHIEILFFDAETGVTIEKVQARLFADDLEGILG